MPRPNLPVRGGTQAPQRAGASSDSGNGCDRCRELAAELEKMKEAATKANRSGSAAGLPFRGSPALMVWAALGVCGMGLLFALLALTHHA